MLPSVWPLPISLATTFGISVDYFSSPYLDVSVQAVPHAYLFDSVYVTIGLLWWVSPFGYPRIVAYLQLPEAFRRLSRPSSAPDAKAFPLRSFQLDQYSFYCLQAFVENPSLVSLSSELCRLIKKFLLAEIVSITLKFLFPYCCLLITFFILCSVFKVHLRRSKRRSFRFRPYLRFGRKLHITLLLLLSDQDPLRWAFDRFEP